MAYTIQLLDITEVSLNDNNPRFIKDKSFKDLVKSLKECPALFDARPLLCNADRVILGGNMRYRAALELRYTEVPVIIMEGLTPEQEREIVIKDNGGFGSWDFEALANGWSDLPLDEWGVDLPEGWLAEPEEAPEEEEFNAEPPKEPITVLGDLYELNNHRIHCGDSCDADVVAKTLNGADPFLMVTDPPYGVEYDADWRNEALREDGTALGGRATGKVLNDDKADWTEAWALSPSMVTYVYHDGLVTGLVANTLQACNYELRSQIIWAKNNFAISRGHYHWKHEPCWYAVKKGSTAKFIGDHSNTTLWQIDKPQKSETGHSTQKPVECMSKPIQNHEGDVYDPFLGSHTTLIASEQNNRTCYGQELNPAYVDIGVRRWVKYMQDNNRPYTVKRNGQELSKAEIDQFFAE